MAIPNKRGESNTGLNARNGDDQISEKSLIGHKDVSIDFGVCCGSRELVALLGVSIRTARFRDELLPVHICEKKRE